MSRRGQRIQSGSPAAALVGIITLLLIFYILFLPPSERLALLEEGDEEALDEFERTLLDEAPGRLAFTEKSVFDHSIPNLYLVESREAIVFARENPFVVKKGWFVDQHKMMRFIIEDIDNTANVLLSFQATERAGNLMISLNDNVVFEGAVKVQNPPPVMLPKYLLQPANVLEFSTSDGFFARKRYALSDVKVIGDVTDIARQRAQNSFMISNIEYDNLDTAYLDFFPICDQRTAGILTIELNGKVVQSAVPACDSLNRQDLYTEDFRTGKNSLIFKIDRGSFRVEQMKIHTTLKPIKAFIDFFHIKSSLYNDVLDNSNDIILSIEFVDDGETKHAEININGK